MESTLNKKDLVAIRVANDSDRNFILATWLRGLYYGDTWFGEIPKNIFMEKYHSILERLLSLDTTITVIACLKDDPEVILGYAVQDLNETTLHYAFVKKAWRNIGIAKDMVSKKTVTATHLTKSGLSILKKHPGVIFNPFI